MDYNQNQNYNQNYNQYSGVQDMKPVKRKKNNGGKTFALLLACGLVSGVAGAGGTYLANQYSQNGDTTPEIVYANPVVEAQKVVTYSSSNLSLPDLYTMNVGATVGITVNTTSVNYFGQPTSSAASGSGFVLTENGYVVTNHHVIEEGIGGTGPIEVKFHDGSSYEAEIVGYEADSDLAVLKIDATGLQTVVVGDSSNLVVGETVVAIGNPLGELDFTFTNGIISAKDRLISIGDGYTMNMLQTNTAINPGNSGGPLFDGAGHLIGINTAKYATSSSGISVEGLGFAIPINDVKDMISDIIANGYVTGKPYLGVTVRDVSADAQDFGVQAGASIVAVAQDGAAWKAGIQADDIVIAIGDVAVDSTGALTAAMNEFRAGDTVDFTIVRSGEEMVLSLTFDEKNAVTEGNNVYTPEEEENATTNGNNWYEWESNFPFGNTRP